MNVKTLTSIATVLFATFLISNVGFCQTTIADVDFDKTEGKKQFGYGFGGYGPGDGSEQVKISSEQFGFKQSISDSGGMSSELKAAELELKKQKESYGASHPSVIATQKKIVTLKTSTNKCAMAVFDTTKMDIPDDANYDYVGFATGADFDLVGKTLPELDPAKVVVSFDAKVTGTKPLSQSKLLIKFLKSDGDDEGTHDDIVVQLACGKPNGEGTFELNSEYQHFEFEMSKMSVEAGALKDLKANELIGIGFTVQAQGGAADFGNDDDNVLYVDNIKMISK